MAIKLAKGVKTIGASLYTGDLSISIGGNNWIIKVPVKQNYPYQVNEHDNPTIFCFLSNDDTLVVIRRNGTGSLINKKQNALIKNFAVELPKELMDVEVHPGGAVLHKDRSKATFTTVCFIKSKWLGIISLEDMNESVVFDIREAQQYLIDLSMQASVAYPVLYYESGRFTCRSNPNDVNSKPLYTFDGKVLQHEAPMIIQ